MPDDYWYSRPVFFVSDLQRSLHFYLDQMGFTKKWHQDTVCQVDRGEGCEIILAEDKQRRDKSRVFIELTPKSHADLVRELEERQVPHRKSWWGYDVIQVDDPDGHELLFPWEQPK